jgi:ribosome-binding protein aMBF1 (putative translation factor)
MLPDSAVQTQHAGRVDKRYEASTVAAVFTAEYAKLLELLRETREQSGVTQVELAKRVKETQSYLSRFERGELRLDVIQLRTICQALGTTLPAFIAKLEDRLAKSKKRS